MSVWIEPSRALPLRWGGYTERYLGGIALIVSGAISLQGGNANFGLPLALGTLAHVIGWWIMPAGGRRRIWAVLPSLAVSWILLMGPAGVGLLAVSFCCWMLVRHRPWWTQLLALPLLGLGFALRGFFAEYSGMIPALAIMMAGVIVASWGAMLGARFQYLHRQRKAQPS